MHELVSSPVPHHNHSLSWEHWVYLWTLMSLTLSWPENSIQRTTIRLKLSYNILLKCTWHIIISSLYCIFLVLTRGGEADIMLTSVMWWPMWWPWPLVLVSDPPVPADILTVPSFLLSGNYTNYYQLNIITTHNKMDA